MKSPFAIFRKYQKVLMVVVTGLAMISFIVFDQISLKTGRGNATFIMVMGALLGGVIFWLMGRQSGKGTVYAAVGALIGLAIGAWLPSNFAAEPPVVTTMGSLTHQDIQHRVRRRQMANNFLEMAYRKVSPPPDNPFMAQFWARGLQSSQFGFGAEPEEDVILGYLLEQEADEMGIRFSDDAVTKYILQATTVGGKGLSKADFQQIRSDLHIAESELYDAIRAELRARLAYILAIPRETTTPEQYWQDYRKLNVRQQLDIAAVPVRDFAAEVPEPTAAELEGYFDQHKNTFLDNPARRTTVPAFGQPRRLRTAYLEADYEEMEKAVAAVTDAEVEKYYNDNKDRYRNRPLPNVEGGGDPFLPKPGQGALPGAGDASPLIPDLTPEKPATEKPAPEKPTTDKPAPEKSSEEKSKGDSGQAKASTAVEGLLAQGPAGSPSVARDLLLSALSEAAEPAKKAEEPKKEAEKTPEPKAEPKSPDAAKADAKNPPDGDKTKAASPADGKRKPVVAERPLPEFKPLDNDLRERIKEELLRERALAAQKAKIEAARDFMLVLGESYSGAVSKLDPELLAEKKQEELTRIAAEMRAKYSAELTRYAEQHKLRYIETKPLSGVEFYDSSEYAIAKAAEPMADEFARRDPIAAAQELFGSPPDQLFLPSIASDRTDKWFAYWKIEEIDSHVPTFDEPGIREQVLAVWKSEQARPKAEERAKAVADLARSSQASMTDALGGQTTNGKKEGNALVVIPTPLVSWLRVSTAPSTGLMPNRQPEMSDIPGVDNPDANFMETIFDKMKVGDVNVVPNADRSVFYVVKVKGRLPSEPSDLEAHRQSFLREDLFGGGSMFGGASTYDYLTMEEQQQVRAAWFQLLNTKYQVRRNQEPDGKGVASSRPLGS